jgi:hypothetical protein
MTRLICHRFRSNEVLLSLSLIAYNLGNLWPGRPLGRVLPKKIENLLADQFATTAGEDWRQAGQACPVLLPESHPTRRLFGSMVRRIEALAVASG